MWETLEGMVREKAQEFIQEILEEEVTELLGREKSERRRAVDAVEGYRNGYGKPRLLAMRGLLGKGAPLSKSSIRRLRAGWTREFEAWSQRSLADREVVYIWADGIYVKAGLERDKAALLVVLGAMRDGTKEVLALRPGYRESVESWSEVLRDLKARGIEAPKLLMADGNAAIWGAVRQVWPEAGEQRCWNHKMRNVLDRLPQREQSEAKDLLRAVVYAPSRAEAVRRPVRRSPDATDRGIRRRWTYSRTTGSGWWRSTTFQRITGSICARRTWSRARSPRSSSERRRRSDSSGSRALQR
jgi:transposase-like protein